MVLYLNGNINLNIHASLHLPIYLVFSHFLLLMICGRFPTLTFADVYLCFLCIYADVVYVLVFNSA